MFCYREVIRYRGFIERVIRRHFGRAYNPLLKIYEAYFDLDQRRLQSVLNRQLQLLDCNPTGTDLVQVGTNDGVTNDPFRKWIRDGQGSLDAYLFEPDAHCFRSLQKNYIDYLHPEGLRRAHLVNMAVTNSPETLVFFSVSELAVVELGSRIPPWWNQLGSFDREHIVKHLDGILEPYILEERVPTTSLDNFLRDRGVAKVDVLHIDAEGHDLQVLASLDIAAMPPKVILLEHKHVSADELANLLIRLSQLGYEVEPFRSDLIAIKNTTESV